MSRSQLFTRNGRYYHRQWIPVDLRSLYGERVELVKSLKTTDKKQALGLASGLHQKYTVTFSLLRSGLLTPEQTIAVLENTSARRRPKWRTETLPPPPPPSLSLSALIELFTKEHLPKWTPKTQQEFAGQFKVLVNTLGDAPVTSYDRPSCVTCRDILLVSGKAPKTVNKYMTLLASLFKWATKHGYMERNLAEGLSLEIQQKPDEERKAYDREDIKRILRYLPATATSTAYDPAKRWVPMVALYSGMRLEEICQLTREDVKCVDGVLCFDINSNGDKRVKTKASNRLVPVHPVLVSMGLEDYIQTRVSGDNLWGLSKGKWGYGKKITNWWTRFFNRKYVTTDPLKCFHSFRHTFADTLKQSGVQESIIAELMGHANESITTGRYGKTYRPKVLLEAVSKIDYK